MILRSLQKSPEKRVPVAMAFITVGLTLLMIGISWPRFSFPGMHLTPEWNDFARGFIFGLAIILEISGLVIVTSTGTIREKKL